MHFVADIMGKLPIPWSLGFWIGVLGCATWIAQDLTKKRKRRGGYGRRRYSRDD